MANVTDTYLTDIAHKKDLLATASGDIDTLSGVANLTNALFHRLVTSPGSLIHQPTYGVGIKDFQNKLNTLENQRKLALRIGTQFVLDPRVSAVLGVVVLDSLDPSLLAIVVRIRPVGSDEQVMRFVPFGGN